MINKSDHVAADGYSERALRRVWRCTHFSWWMTTMLHTQGDDFDAQLQKSQLDWVNVIGTGRRGLAENYAACQSAIDTDDEEPVDASV
jgi:p-hydroxybenzoate 3-monooxygenase